MVIDNLLEVIDGRLQNVPDFLRTARSPVRELDSLSHLPPSQFVFRLGPVDALAGERDSLLSFSQYVERLIDDRQRIHVTAIGLARPEIFVLELEFWVRAKPSLFLQSLGGRHSLAFGFEEKHAIEVLG